MVKIIHDWSGHNTYPLGHSLGIRQSSSVSAQVLSGQRTYPAVLQDFLVGHKLKLETHD